MADVTGDANRDVEFNLRLIDIPIWYGQNNGVIQRTNGLARAFNMRKTGPGTLFLGNIFNAFTGRIEVAEGTLEPAKRGPYQQGQTWGERPTHTAIGDVSSRDTRLVITGTGELYLPDNDMLGQANAQMEMTFAVTNGTIRQAAGKVNALPYLDLYDAHLDYSGYNSGSGRNGKWGTFIFARALHFAGTRPYDWQPIGGTTLFSLGFEKDTAEEPSGDLTLITGKTEFNVDDITGSADVDVTIGVPLQKATAWNSANAHYFGKTIFQTGLLKTGAGTLRLNAAQDTSYYYTHATRVNAGTLLVDSRDFKSTNIFVQAGAYVGGTGTVARLTFEPGGGLTAAPGQTKALTVTAAELPSDNIVAVDIPCTGTLGESVPLLVPLATAGAFTGAKWNVTVNGAAVPKGFSANVSVRAGVLVASLSKGGAMIVIR